MQVLTKKKRIQQEFRQTMTIERVYNKSQQQDLRWLDKLKHKRRGYDEGFCHERVNYRQSHVSVFT